MSETALATQEVEQEILPGSENVEEPGEGNQDEPFLKVNDRTTYKTREEALKGFANAQKEITSFSAFKKLFGKYGIKEPSPEHIESLFLELVDRRAKEADAKKKEPAKATPESGDEELDANDKKAIEWLKKRGVKAGYVSKEDFESIKAELASLKQGNKSQQDAQFNSIVAEGQEEFGRLIAEAKLAPTDEQKDEMEENIKAWINGSDSRIEQFNSGGKRMLALIKTAFEREVKAMGLTPPKLAPQAKTKMNQMNRFTKPLPRDGTGNAPQLPPGPRKIDMHAIHDKGWEMLQKMSRKQED